MIWTPELLAERLGGDEQLARELVAIFLVEYQKLLEAVRVSVSSRDADAIRRSAHALKGAIANFVDQGPTATAFELEKAGRESRLPETPGLMAELEQQVDELVRAMRRSESDPCAS